MTADLMQPGLMQQSVWSDQHHLTNEAQRAAADQATQCEHRRCAARAIAGAARDVTDARMLLEMLGLSPEDIRAAAHASAA